MPFVARLLLFACAFRDFFAEALQLDLRGNPFSIHVYAFKQPLWHLPRYFEHFCHPAPRSTAQIAGYRSITSPRASGLGKSALYYDCADDNQSFYTWPEWARVNTCDQLDADVDTILLDRKLVFIGLHKNDDYSVDLPEGLKRLLLSPPHDGGIVVLVSDASPRQGFGGRKPTPEQHRWTEDMPMKNVPKGYAVYSMLPSIPPVTRLWGDIPPGWQYHGGVESIIYAVKQAMQGPLGASSDGGAGGRSPTPPPLCSPSPLRSLSPLRSPSPPPLPPGRPPLPPPPLPARPTPGPTPGPRDTSGTSAACAAGASPPPDPVVPQGGGFSNEAFAENDDNEPLLAISGVTEGDRKSRFKHRPKSKK